ncbi:sucrase ferredoxin [Nocardioides sp. S-58]|uniref:Sucrase ferredoxin n=1 Tax=Nocardioides renjunii TaxID=3095075 RepID=A0ABU5K986_9ACTN|nr:sucrase ferredoxin [Nocardioides sp. S-58]MDZ5661015.1 sucrase ferredoxin [Nocardioides sp. S-58]
MTAFRCAVASRARGDELAGTASTVRSWLLVERGGPWGSDALRDARLPEGVGAHLRDQARRHRVRVLLVRRPGRQQDGGTTRVFAARSAGAGSWLETAALDRVDDVADLDLAALGAGRSPGLEPQAAPVLAVCTHGRHDACCAELGRPLARALADGPHADQVWESSHVGGDRFAGNVVVLPRGLYYGGLDADTGPAVAAATASGELLLDHLRGRSDLPMAVQAADVALRRSLGLVGLDDVRVLGARADGDLTTTRLDAVGHGVREVVVRRVLGEEPHLLTCSARGENAIPRHEVVEVRETA